MAIYVKSEESRGWMEATIQRYAKRCWRMLEEEWGEVRAVCDPPRIGFYGWRGCNAAARIIYLRRVAEIARAEIYLSICPRVCRIRDQNTISLRKVNCRAPSCPRVRRKKEYFRYFLEEIFWSKCSNESISREVTDNN